ncbi:hypothetical protein [Methylobacterium variabile]|jgi:hypothetical protein|uniref:hypothetical protein n=1 Tax=Methylobacterium variabile TaxID=298794 RepID=UPI000AC3142C|nr:hypothetical protein [Methylobacterium variabile]
MNNHSAPCDGSGEAGETRSDEATRYAERLAVALWEKHWKADAPLWRPLAGDLVGILTQIDNMTTGLVRKEEAQGYG